MSLRIRMHVGQKENLPAVQSSRHKAMDGETGLRVTAPLATCRDQLDRIRKYIRKRCTAVPIHAIRLRIELACDRQRRGVITALLAQSSAG